MKAQAIAAVFLVALAGGTTQSAAASDRHVQFSIRFSTPGYHRPPPIVHYHRPGHHWYHSHHQHHAHGHPGGHHHGQHSGYGGHRLGAHDHIPLGKNRDGHRRR